MAYLTLSEDPDSHFMVKNSIFRGLGRYLAVLGFICICQYWWYIYVMSYFSLFWLLFDHYSSGNVSQHIRNNDFCPNIVWKTRFRHPWDCIWDILEIYLLYFIYHYSRLTAITSVELHSTTPWLLRGVPCSPWVCSGPSPCGRGLRHWWRRQPWLGGPHMAFLWRGVLTSPSTNSFLGCCCLPRG